MALLNKTLCHCTCKTKVQQLILNNETGLNKLISFKAIQNNNLCKYWNKANTIHMAIVHLH